MASVNLSCIGYFDQPNTGFTVHLYTGKSMKNTSSTEAVMCSDEYSDSGYKEAVVFLGVIVTQQLGVRFAIGRLPV